MAYEALTTAEVASGKPITNALMEKIKENLAYLYGTLGSLSTGQIQNASFEIDSDADGEPDNWDVNLYTAGASGLYETDPAHGGKSLYFTHPGGASNGGGYADSDYIEVATGISMLLFFMLWSTAAGVKNMVQVRYFDKDKSELGSGSPETLYTSTSNPTSATMFQRAFTPPATCKFVKVRLIGGYTDTNVAATTYFDRIGARILPVWYPGNYGSVQSCAGGTTASTSIVKINEATVYGSGGLRLKFTMYTNHVSYPAYGRIYRNGVAVGTLRSTNALTPGTEFSEDISGWKAGDLLQIYGYGTGAYSSAIGTVSGYAEQYDAVDTR